MVNAFLGNFMMLLPGHNSLDAVVPDAPADLALRL